MGEQLANALHSCRGAAPAGSALQAHCAEGESLLANQTLKMSRDAGVPWWGFMEGHVNRTIYESDINLGQPDANDCAQLEYSCKSPENS